jgi:glycosyltransferase 2 family protein
VLDGLVVVGLLFAAMAMPGFPALPQSGVDLRAAALLVLVLMGGVGVVLAALVVAPGWSARRIERVANRLLPVAFRRPLLDALHSFLGGIAVLRSGRLLLLSAAWALGQWLFLALSYWLAFRAFGIHEAGFVAAVFLQSLIGLAVAIPSVPGFFGPFQAAAALGLSLWTVPTHKVAAFAIGFHIGGFIPVTLLGLFFLWRTGLSWREVGRSDETVEERAAEQRGEEGGKHSERGQRAAVAGEGSRA